MKWILLDTNTVSHIIRNHPKVLEKLVQVPITSLCISCITYAEIRYGLAKRPDAKQLHLTVVEFLKRVDVLAWDKEVADYYGILRASMETTGKNLSSLDLQIAAHAVAIDAVLITNDKAFAQVPRLKLEDWTI